MTPPFLPPPARAGFASTSEDSANTSTNLEEMLIRRPAIRVSSWSISGACWCSATL